MTTATMEIYSALIDAGVDEKKAEIAAKAVISRREMEQTFASKAELYRALLIQTGVLITAMGVFNSIVLVVG